MTPLYDNSEYYKKMLDLQERLRKSEEERIRLEERFTLLEHESRSRHEACINRLRMRYIDFLEEQQSRDERNHQLLEALDRVDSRLTLMTAKTDRLAALKKRYEAAIRNENRRPNGSVTGDSGVASQKDAQRGKLEETHRRVRNDFIVANHDEKRINREDENRENDSSFVVRPGSSCDEKRSEIQRESSRMHPAPLAFSNFPQDETSIARINRVPSFLNVEKSPEEFRHFHRSKDIRNSNESISRSFPREINVPHRRSSSFVDHRSVVSSSLYEKPEFPRDARFDNNVARNLATSGAYETAVESTRSRDSKRRHFDDSDDPKSLRQPARSSIEEDRKSLKSSILKSPKLSEILRHELDNDDEYVGGIVENQLERYISKIKSLHRDEESRSFDELDHEENTSGDLLNVTLSDDPIDSPAEEKPSDKFYHRELDNVLAIAKDLAERTATSAISVANNIYQHNSSGIFRENHQRSRNNVANVKTDEIRELISINQPLDEGNSREEAEPCEKYVKIGKNETLDDIAKSRVKLASGTNENIRDVTEFIGNEGENVGTTIMMKNSTIDINEDEWKIYRDRVSNVEEREGEFAGPSLDLRRVKESPRGLMTSEEIADEDNFHDISEDLRPWNLSALERRVQEIILNDEAQDDFIKRSTVEKMEENSIDSEKHNDDSLGIDDDFYHGMNNRKINEARVPEDTRKNDKRDDIREGIENAAASKEKDSTLEKCEMLIDESGEKIVRGDSNVLSEEKIDDVDHDAEYGTEKINYTYPETGEYVRNENPEETSFGYDGDRGECGYSEQQYFQENIYDPNQEYLADSTLQYNNDPNHQYSTDPDKKYLENSPQESTNDPDQEYLAKSTLQYNNDPNQYPSDPNEKYPENSPQESANDPNQEYLADSTLQYNNDPNHQYSTDPDKKYPENSLKKCTNDPDQEYLANSTMQYNNDPNQHSSDPIKKYPENSPQESTNDPDQEYLADSTMQYNNDPNQYSSDPDKKYPENSPQESANDPNQEYLADSILQYNNDPNHQYSTDPDKKYPENSPQESANDPNQEYLADSTLQYNNDPNHQYSTDPDKKYPENSLRKCTNDPDQEYLANSTMQYNNDPNRHSSDPNKKYPENSPQESTNDPDQEYLADSTMQYNNDPNRYSSDPNEKYPENSPQESTNDPDQEYLANSTMQYPNNSNHQYSTDPDKKYPENSPQEYPADSTLQYPDDSNHRYSTDPDEKYPENSTHEYNDPNQKYPEQYPAPLNEGNIVDPSQDYSANIGPDHRHSQDAAYPRERNSIDENSTTDYPQRETTVTIDPYNRDEEGTTIFDKREETTRHDDSPRNTDKKISSNSRMKESAIRKNKDVIKSILESDTDSTIEKNVSNTESDFDFN